MIACTCRHKSKNLWNFWSTNLHKTNLKFCKKLGRHHKILKRMNRFWKEHMNFVSLMRCQNMALCHFIFSKSRKCAFYSLKQRKWFASPHKWLIVFAVPHLHYGAIFLSILQASLNEAKLYNPKGTFITLRGEALCRCYASNWLLPLSEKKKRKEKKSQLELGLFIGKYISLVINCKTQIQIISTQERAFWLCKNDIKKMQIVGVLGTKHMLPRCQQACPWRSQLEASKTCFWQRIFFPHPVLQMIGN